jgi:hypothetical protein
MTAHQQVSQMPVAAPYQRYNSPYAQVLNGHDARAANHASVCSMSMPGTNNGQRSVVPTTTMVPMESLQAQIEKEEAELKHF